MARTVREKAASVNSGAGRGWKRRPAVNQEKPDEGFGGTAQRFNG
jgi:hypothetical protein